MTQHDHAEVTPGCYRCDLGKDEITPTDAERVSTIREALAEFMADELPAEAIEEWFDRWLADHDAQVASGALKDAASASSRPENGAPYEVWAWFSDWLRTRADQMHTGGKP